MQTRNRRAKMGTWFLLVVFLISSTASLENDSECVLKDPGMHFISVGNRTVLKVGENANVSCKSGYQIMPNKSVKRPYEYDYPDSESTTDPSEMPETEDNENLVQIRAGNYTCRDNGNWEPEIPFSCKQIICDSFYGYNLENGHIFYSRSAYIVGTVASFLCNPGYIRHGPETRKCQIDGTWSGECVTCQMIIRNPSITCPAPCVPEGARKTGSYTYEIGSRVYFHCPQSKTQDRDDRSRFKYCIKDGDYASWKGTKINCKEIICDKGDHYGLENGKVTYSSSVPTVGTKALFMCNPGYNRRGPTTRICKKDGTWSRGCVTCQKHQHNSSTCPAPCVPDGAKRIGSISYELGSIIQVYCFQSNVRYRVESRYTRHCVNNGISASWNGTKINCKARCEPLTDTYNVVQNGVVPGILSDKTVVELSCSRSLAPVQAECRNGHWYPEKPTCEERCNITNTTITNGHFRNRGNVIVAGEKINSGSNIHLLCNDGHELYNKTNSRYLELEHTAIKCYQGIFIPEIPLCGPKRCNITITTIENGFFRKSGNVINAGEKIHSGSNIQLICYDGYELYNKTNSMYFELEHTGIKCYQGLLIPEIPSCQPKRCIITITTIENGHVRKGGNGIVAGEKINSGSNIQLRCYDGYELYNKTNSMYLESEHTDIQCYHGSFIPETPSCEPKRCNITIRTFENGHFTNRKNGIDAGEKIISGSNITLVCFDGYELFNDSIYKYLESEKTDLLCYQGSFTVAFPKCKPKRCLIDRSLFLLPEVHYVEHGQDLTVHCPDNMNLLREGNYQELQKTSISCRKGKWTQNLPMCNKNIMNIRLAGSADIRSMGRVEIQDSRGTWGTVCDDGFDVNDAKVVCRMLGFTSGYVSAYRNSYFGEGTGPIWLDNLGCNGNETDLYQCSSSKWGGNNCDHTEDASVDCSLNIKNIRLAGNGGTRFKGRVEIQGPNGTWGTVCDDDFDVNVAKVVCRMLGFTSGYVSAYQSAHFGQGTGPIWLDDLECNGNEINLGHCNSFGWGRHNCEHGEDASVACDFVVRNIRLAGKGSTASRGRVEVSSPNGTWGTICGYSFDPSDAMVVCRMLGFNNVTANAYRNSYFGAGSGPVWFASLNCRGNEANLDQCSSSDSSCDHNYDAGVACGNDAILRNARLVGRRSTHEGRVEVLGPDGTWGSLANIDGNAAQVICRTLGFDKGYRSIFNSSTFGLGSGPTYYFYNNGCTGRESHISECFTSNFLVNYYGNGDDIGVSCHKDSTK